MAPTFDQIKTAGQSKDPPQNGPWTNEEKPADATYRCYACGTALSDTQEGWTVRCSDPSCRKDQPSLPDLSWRKRGIIEKWRDDILQIVDGKGESVQFDASNVARSPSPLVRTEGGGQPDPQWGKPDRNWQMREGESAYEPDLDSSSETK